MCVDEWGGINVCAYLAEITDSERLTAMFFRWLKTVTIGSSHTLSLSLSRSLLHSTHQGQSMYRTVERGRKRIALTLSLPSFSSFISLFSLLPCSHSSFLFHSLSFPLTHSLSPDRSCSPSLTCSLMNVTFTGGSRWICAHTLVQTHTHSLALGWRGGNVGLWGEIACARRGRREISRSPFFFLPAPVLRLRALSVPAAEAEVPLDVGALDYRSRLLFFSTRVKFATGTVGWPSAWVCSRFQLNNPVGGEWRTLLRTKQCFSRKRCAKL